MKFTLTKGANPDAEIIPSERRGRIIDNRTQAQKEACYALITKSPRLMGKKESKSN